MYNLKLLKNLLHTIRTFQSVVSPLNVAIEWQLAKWNEEERQTEEYKKLNDFELLYFRSSQFWLIEL